MQMYRVNFRFHKEKTIDCGEVVVTATSNENACDIVCLWLDLPRSATSIEATRVKPGLYQVSRHEVPKDLPINGTFPRTKAELERLLEPDRERYSVQVSAFVWAHSEDSAIKKLAKATLAEVDGSGKKPRAKAIGMLQILCDRNDLAPRSPAIERNAIYTHRRFFAGGDTRSG
jgi:hypothetical protein